MEECPFTLEADAAEVLSQQVQTMLTFWAAIAEEVSERLIKQNDRMVRTYLKRKDLAKVDVRHIFNHGE